MSQKMMLQQVVTKPGTITFKEIPIPKINDSEVLIKIQMIGICGSDIHVMHGKHAFTTYPVTQGHEVSGEVVEIGSDITDLKIGDRVTIEPQVVCGVCHPCRHGKYNLCESLKVMGFQTTGAASTFFAVDRKRVTSLPNTMSFKDGAMIEPMAVAVHAIKRMGDITGLNVAVIGAGPIGNLIAQTAKGMGAAKTMITDISDYRLSLAEDCGVDSVFNTKKVNFNDALIAAFGSDKADVIYDCAGTDSSIGDAIAHARKGSAIILVAVFANIAKVDLAVLNDHELDLNTTMMYRHEDYLEAIRLVNENKVELKPLQSKVFPFREYQKAYEYIEKNQEHSMKIFIEVQNQ